VRITGEAEGEQLDLATDDGVAVIGTKADGAPGDLEIIFEIDGDFYVLQFDDLAIALPGDVLPDNRIDLERAAGRVRLEFGTTTVEALDLTGAFTVRAVGQTDAGGTDITIEVSGTFIE
jgi:hypothetical protein